MCVYVRVYVRVYVAKALTTLLVCMWKGCGDPLLESKVSVCIASTLVSCQKTTNFSNTVAAYTTLK